MVIVGLIDKRYGLFGSELLCQESAQDVRLFIICNRNEVIGILYIFFLEQVLACPVSMETDGPVQPGSKYFAPVLSFSIIFIVSIPFSLTIPQA